MGHDKLRKFAENETFPCLLQPSAAELLADGYFALRDHEVKGHWGERFSSPSAPLVLELGCGKGEYTTALAEREPAKNYVGVDIKGARLWKGAKYATEKALGNVGFLRTRIEFITAFFAPGEVSEIWLTFSDPQVRSENSRLTSPPFLERYSKFLKDGGLVHLKTDSQFLYQYTLAVCRANGLPVLASSEDIYAEPERFDPSLTEVQTFYESMFREQGYPIKYLCFRLESSPAPRTFVSPADFDPDYWRSVEGDRTLFGRDTAETRRQKLHRKV
ncbi:MAG: tRNA (guanosine(46)-N7)-methyltransferase TrmB [Bacteroidales bacterium]|nr:tRNA (guanosine(46)-N7)-methyltransferase TrmB [Bacteroidales bacterium]